MWTLSFTSGKGRKYALEFRICALGIEIYNLGEFEGSLNRATHPAISTTIKGSVSRAPRAREGWKENKGMGVNVAYLRLYTRHTEDNIQVSGKFPTIVTLM